jgi:hypothetical protein
MSKGNPQAGGSTSGFGSQGQFGTGYTQPYGAPGTGTYDPMLGFGQASGMGTTYNYPTRYSADYSRYAQSGQQFNQPVMGYNTYGQIFAQPQRPPPPIMGGGKGGGGFRPQPPPMMGGGKGGYDPNRRMQANPGFDTPFGNFPQPRRPERRTNQLGLNQRSGPGYGPPVFGGGMRTADLQDSNLDGIDDRDQGPRTGGPGATPPPLTADEIFEPGSQPPTIGGKGGGGQTNNITTRRPSVGFDPEGRFRIPKPPPVGAVVGPYTGGFGNNVPEPMFDMNQEFRSYPGGSTPRGGVGQSLPSDISGSPFGQLIGVGLGGMGGNPPRPEDFTRPILDQSEPQPYKLPPPGMMRNPNYNAARAMQDDMPRGQEDYLSRQPFIPVGGGFGNMAFFQEGGQVPPDAASNMEVMLSEAGPANPQSEMAGEYDRLIQMTMQAVLGQTENADEIIQMFIDEFGVDAFRQLRDAVLKQQVPNAQTEGMVDGNGGGMDDQVMGMIGNQRPVAVSPGEYIVPADVVSGLGDGSSKSGADILDELNQAVRMARTGTPEQPRPLMETLQQ